MEFGMCTSGSNLIESVLCSTLWGAGMEVVASAFTSENISISLYCRLSFVNLHK